MLPFRKRTAIAALAPPRSGHVFLRANQHTRCSFFDSQQENGLMDTMRQSPSAQKLVLYSTLQATKVMGEYQI